jgi:hypothetical protein
MAAPPDRRSSTLDVGSLTSGNRRPISRAPSPLPSCSVAAKAGRGPSARGLSTRLPGRVQMSPVIASRRHAETAAFRLHRQP